jgi:hypothetical protein
MALCDYAYEHFYYLTVGENIYSNGTAIKRPLARKHCATSRKVAGSIPCAVIGIFFIGMIRPHYGPGVDSFCNRNEYQEYFLRGKGGRCIGLITLLPLCAGCHDIWEPQPPGTLRACPGLYGDWFSDYRVWPELQRMRNYM